jgi:hypothetical protein
MAWQTPPDQLNCPPPGPRQGAEDGGVLVSIVTHRGGKSLNGRTEHEVALAADGGHRAQIIQGLHDLARWLEAHPGIPAPAGITAQYTAPTRDEVDRIAALAGAGVSEYGGSCGTQRYFSPRVDYKAVATSAEVMAAWDEAMRVFRGSRPAAGSVAA